MVKKTKKISFREMMRHGDSPLLRYTKNGSQQDSTEERKEAKKPSEKKTPKART